MDHIREREDDRWNAVLIDTGDNVAVALAELSGHAHVLADGRLVDVPLREQISMGHKFAVRFIAKGDVVLKYGQAIGRATADIPAGAHAHVQNVASNRAEAES